MPSSGIQEGPRILDDTAVWSGAWQGLSVCPRLPSKAPGCSHSHEELCHGVLLPCPHQPDADSTAGRGDAACLSQGRCSERGLVGVCGAFPPMSDCRGRGVELNFRRRDSVASMEHCSPWLLCDTSGCCGAARAEWEVREHRARRWESWACWGVGRVWSTSDPWCLSA